MDGLERFLDIAIPEEIQAPAHGVADNVGCQSAIEGGDSALILGDAADDAD